MSQICFLVGIGIALLATKERSLDIPDILIDNIEALTNGENDVGGMIECHGAGGIYCPINKQDIYQSVIYYQ